MNVRQKAKHFKKLYEDALPKKPYPVVFKTVPLRHYRAEQFIDIADIAYLQGNPQLLRTQVENRILQEIRPLIWNNIKSERSSYSNKCRYWLDVWFEQ